MKKILVTLENFNQNEIMEITKLLKGFLNEKMLFIPRVNNLYFNLVKRFYGTDKIDSTTCMLLDVAELNQFVKNELETEFNKNNHIQIIVTEKYFDSVALSHLDLKFTNVNRVSLYGHQKHKPDLTLIKLDLNTDSEELQKRIGDLIMKDPNRCKVIHGGNYQNKEILEHFIYMLKSK